jgi:hypothetical protein
MRRVRRRGDAEQDGDGGRARPLVLPIDSRQERVAMRNMMEMGVPPHRSDGDGEDDGDEVWSDGRD